MQRWFLLFMMAACIEGGLHAQTFNLQTQRQPLVSLDGLWRFHTGDNPEWANPNFDDSKWPVLRSDEDWYQQGYKGYGGFAWYRFAIKDPTGDKPLALLVTIIQGGYRVYADGKLIGGYGYILPHHLLMLGDYAVYDLPRGSGSGPRDIHIAIRVWHNPLWASYIAGGPLKDGNLAGESSLIHDRLRILQLADSTSLVDRYAYGVVLATFFGLLVLGLFLLRRKEREYLWFAMVVLALALDAAFQIGNDSRAIPYQIFLCADGCCTAVYAMAALLFFSTVLRVRRSLWWWLSFGAAALIPVGNFLWAFDVVSTPVADAVVSALDLPWEIWILAALARRTIQRDADAQLLFFPVLLSFGLDLASNVATTTYYIGWQKWRFGFDWVILHHPFEVQLSTIVSTIFLLGMMFFLIRRFSLARREEERLKSELNAARSVQALLVPAADVETPGFAVDSVYRPASEVGGDFFQLLPGDDGSLLVVVGDVSGKGLRAAMTVSTIVGSLRNEKERRPAAVLRNLNSVLYGHTSGFATCAAALITGDGTMTLANAGHLAPYCNGKEMVVEPGLPLGTLAEARYEETTYQLNPGDRLTFVSDGVVEATNERQELFGFERTQAISSEPAQAIAEVAQKFGQQDDISVLSVTRLGVREEAIA